jgi:hypothetical protein
MSLGTAIAGMRVGQFQLDLTNGSLRTECAAIVPRMIVPSTMTIKYTKRAAQLAHAPE